MRLAVRYKFIDVKLKYAGEEKCLLYTHVTCIYISVHIDRVKIREQVYHLVNFDIVVQHEYRVEV